MNCCKIKYIHRVKLSFILFLFALLQVNGQTERKIDALNRLMFTPKVDSILSTMSESEKIAQLFWLPVFAPGTGTETNTINKLVETYQPGGLLYFRTNPATVITLTNQLQAKSKIPLIVSLDGEWGLGMRLNNTTSFPYQMTLGAIQNDTLIYEMGLAVADQFKRMGIHVNFAPVVDVNVNPKNPVIGYRSFGENPQIVARKASAYMNGMQDGGIMAVAKHFPGHGDTDSDSHKTLPIITHSRARLDSIELYPFRSIINDGILGVMSAHLEVPILDSVAGRPASISKPIVTDLLRNEIGFKGLIITDAMNMNGVKKTGEPGKVDALALIAGNDIIEFTEDLPNAIKEVKKAIDSSLITWSDIDLKVRRSLALKELLNIQTKQKISPLSSSAELNNDAVKDLNVKLYKSSLTLLSKDSVELPLLNSSDKKSVVLLVGKNSGFLSSIDKQKGLETIYLPFTATKIQIENALKQIKLADNIILALSDPKKIAGLNNSSKTISIDQFIYDVCSMSNTKLIFFGNPYQLAGVNGFSKAPVTIVAYQDNSMVQKLVGQALNDSTGFTGKLPVSVASTYQMGEGGKIKE